MSTSNEGRRRRFERDDDAVDSGSASSSGGSMPIILIVVGLVVCGGVGLIGVLIALLLPAVSKTRDAAERMTSTNNIKQIALAFHNYHDSLGHLPPVATKTKDGKVGLSWRVHLLPYVEQDNLYRMFKLDEAWDSPNNLPLLQSIPNVYVSRKDPPGTTNTRYRCFVGGGALFDKDRLTRFSGGDNEKYVGIRDGTANTILCVEADDSVPWTKAEEIEYNPNGPLPSVGKFRGNLFLAGFADGSVQSVKVPIPDATFRGIITRSGGEVVNLP